MNLQPIQADFRTTINMWQNQMKQTKSCAQKLSSKSVHDFTECQNDCSFFQLSLRQSFRLYSAVFPFGKIK